MRAELLDYQRRHLKPPGDPILTPEFRRNHALTGDVPRLEAQRREDTARAKLHVRVLFNNQLVSQTKEWWVMCDRTIKPGHVLTTLHTTRVHEFLHTISHKVYIDQAGQTFAYTSFTCLGESINFEGSAHNLINFRDLLIQLF